MIPKKIHYCWFGGNPLPENAKKCISSWKRYCPDYEIKEWNESNFNLNCNVYVKEAYEKKKWAFITDYVRLYAMVSEGGIYMDTDVEVIKPLDEFLNLTAFSGFQGPDEIPTGIMASEKDFPFFDSLLHWYDDKHFVNHDGSMNMTTNVQTITQACLKEGLVLNDKLQVISGFTLYPHDVFCAKDRHTGIEIITKNTVTIHHFAGSWVLPSAKMSAKIKLMFENKRFPLNLLGKIIAFPWTFDAMVKTRGFKNAVIYFFAKPFTGI